MHQLYTVPNKLHQDSFSSSYECSPPISPLSSTFDITSSTNSIDNAEHTPKNRFRILRRQSDVFQYRSDGRPMNGLTSRRKQWKTRPWASTASPLPEWYVPFLLLHFVDMGFEQQGD
ncbi:unnamed protein product [Auanema sp. JU1783]|nr:unnamed protein product [Auanema sp. JU1783]